MKQKNVANYVNEIIKHKVFGDVFVKEIVSVDEGKFIGKIVESMIEKKFILSKQFFILDQDVSDIVVKCGTTFKPQVKKQRDYNKYRSHPLVKKIDKREAQFRRQVLKMQDLDDEDDD